MSSINSNEIISILKEEIENFDMMSKDSEVGTVITVGDGIASIYGIDHAMYGEIVTFENGLKGMVQDIRRNEIGCILFGSDTTCTNDSSRSTVSFYYSSACALPLCRLLRRLHFSTQI